MHRRALSKIYLPPESHVEIARYAERLLVSGGCLGVLPTPVEELYRVGNVEEVKLHQSDLASIFSNFSQRAKDAVTSLLSKIRGAADLRRRVVFMPRKTPSLGSSSPELTNWAIRPYLGTGSTPTSSTTTVR